MSIEIPAGLEDLLVRFTVEVLRNQPRDPLDFAVQYFQRLNQNQNQNRGGGSSESLPSPTAARPGAVVSFTEPDAERSGEEDEELVAPVAIRFTRRVSVSAETYNPDDEDEELREPRIVHPKTDEQRQRLQEACKHILLFKNLDAEQMSQVLDAMFERRVEVGELIIEQDDDGDNFYVIERGTFSIYMKVDGLERLVGTYNNRGSFGELALMYNTQRAATIITTSAGALWCLDRMTFRRIIVRNNAKKRKLYEAFVESVPLLESLQSVERMKVVDVLGCQTYSDGERIIAQGDSADCFYIVESGQVRIVLNKKGAETEIAVCSRGQYFGELALITNKPRAASAYAVGTVKCLVMDVQAFERLLGPCKDIMKRNIANYEEQLARLFERDVDGHTETAGPRPGTSEVLR
ncbi:cAMP-dependent protein kinase type II-beta regulatory subunit-like [Pygocentrus nattereri]|uniref:cAMP-dependent protein kinase type II-beta regulatory subunit-like n=1 Tax=Pygocentrus nattereri TaxID=42514 RepID=UPI001891AA3C|nr:cAMP-dependent protein kinase type II-beta regulatory subunit-like [Pygocentrus nattereri]